MSEPASNVQWWKVEKELSVKRRAAQSASAAGAKPGDSFLIVTEGQVTEPTYFELLRESLQLATVTVKIQPGRGSDPRNVIESAAAEVVALAKRVKKKQTSIKDIESYDHVWAVIDTDVAVRTGEWADMLQLAASRKVKLAHSTPCFEFWLLLHIQGYTTRSDLRTGSDAKEAVKTALGRDFSTNAATAKAVIPTFLSRWPEAIKHAQGVRAHHQAANTKPPGNPSTDVDLLALALNAAAAMHHRKL